MAIDNRRASLQRFVVSYIFALSAYYITAGVAQTQFAKQMGMPDQWFAVLGALPMIGSLMQLPASIISSKIGRRKLTVICMGLFDRALWMGIAAIPWIFPDGPWRWGGMLVMLTTLYLTVNIAAPLQQAWMADVVPPRITGRFFGKMRQIGQIAAFGLIVLLGWALDYAERSGAEKFRLILSSMFVLSALLGMTEVALLAPIPDPLNKRPAVQLKLSHLIAGPLRDRQFARYLAFNCSATFANLFLVTYVMLYLIDVVKLSNSRINLLMLVIPMIFTIPAYAIWGKFIDRVGIRSALILAMIGVAPSGITYAMMTPDSWVGWYILQLFVSACYCGVEVATLSWLMSFGRSKDGVPGSNYIAVSSILNGVVGLCAGALVGWTVSKIGTHWTGSLLGIPLTYHRVLMLISVGLRLSTLAWLLPWRQEGSMSLRHAVKDAPGFFAIEAWKQVWAPFAYLRKRLIGSRQPASDLETTSVP